MSMRQETKRVLVDPKPHEKKTYSQEEADAILEELEGRLSEVINAAAEKGAMFVGGFSIKVEGPNGERSEAVGGADAICCTKCAARLTASLLASISKLPSHDSRPANAGPLKTLQDFILFFGAFSGLDDMRAADGQTKH